MSELISLKYIVNKYLILIIRDSDYMNLLEELGSI